MAVLGDWRCLNTAVHQWKPSIAKTNRTTIVKSHECTSKDCCPESVTTTQQMTTMTTQYWFQVLRWLYLINEFAIQSPHNHLENADLSYNLLENQPISISSTCGVPKNTHVAGTYRLTPFFQGDIRVYSSIIWTMPISTDQFDPSSMTVLARCEVTADVLKNNCHPRSHSWQSGVFSIYPNELAWTFVSWISNTKSNCQMLCGRNTKRPTGAPQQTHFQDYL